MKNNILTKKEPEKSLTIFLKEKAGRSSSGRITVRHRGAGAKRLYRLIDFGEEKLGVPAEVIAIEYDPYRTGYIMLLKYENGKKAYRLAPSGINVGDKVICQDSADIKIGNRMKIKNIPVGTQVFEIELEAGRGGKMVRSAGAVATILAHEGKYANFQMPSGEIRKAPTEGFATIGQVSRQEWRYQIIGKAGSSRHRRRRPAVRGSAMNPVDHPHGGGEGRTPIGLPHPKTPWGKPALGFKTRKRKKWTSKLIIQRKRYVKKS